jgi:hypothetical protein
VLDLQSIDKHQDSRSIVRTYAQSRLNGFSLEHMWDNLGVRQLKRLNRIAFSPTLPGPIPVHPESAELGHRGPAKLLTELSTHRVGSREHRKNNDLARTLASVTDDSEAYNL